MSRDPYDATAHGFEIASEGTAALERMASALEQLRPPTAVFEEMLGLLRAQTASVQAEASGNDGVREATIANIKKTEQRNDAMEARMLESHEFNRRQTEALEAIAKPRDQANLGLALKLKEAEERAAALLQMLRAVKEMLSQRQETTAGLESVMALLETVTP